MEDRTEGPQKIENELPYDPAIPILGIYLKKTEALNSKRHMQSYLHSQGNGNNLSVHQQMSG